jgi:hypothetical protein
MEIKAMGHYYSTAIFEFSVGRGFHATKQGPRGVTAQGELIKPPQQDLF